MPLCFVRGVGYIDSAMDTKKHLLIQIRQTPNVKAQELNCFSKYSGLSIDEFEVCDLFENPNLEGIDPKNYRAIFVGGASEANVLMPEKYKFVLPAQDFLIQCLADSVPVFASCFGFQLAVQALGGKIVHEEKNFEMGSLPISLKPVAHADPVFKGIEDKFKAISVHQQKTTSCPPNTELLAYTVQCVHAFKVYDKPFWAFQFHPEVDRETLLDRLTFYKLKYLDDDNHLEKVLSAVEATPQSHQLLRNFVENVLNPKSTV